MLGQVQEDGGGSGVNEKDDGSSRLNDDQLMRSLYEKKSWG